MKLTLTVLLTLLAASCVHQSPKTWFASEHREMMAECRAMCKGQALSYTPYDGECKCVARRVKGD